MLWKWTVWWIVPKFRSLHNGIHLHPCYSHLPWFIHFSWYTSGSQKESCSSFFFSISWSSKMTDCAQRIHHVFLSTHWCLGEVSFSWKVRGHQQRLGIRRSTGAWYGGFLKWWYPTTMGFPTKDDHFRVFWGYHHLRKHPYRSGTSVGIHWSTILFSTCKLEVHGNEPRLESHEYYS